MDVLSYIVSIIVGTLSVLCLTIYTFYSYKYGYWKRRGVPGPKPYFPYGNFASMFTRHISEPFMEIYERNKHLPFLGIYSLWYPVLVVHDLELIKHVLIKDASYFDSRGWYLNEKVEPLSAHIGALKGKAWKDMRTKLSPAFTSGKTKMMFSSMMQVAKNFEMHLKEQKKITDNFEFKHLMSFFTSENISNSVFGLETNTFKTGYNKIAEFAHKMLLPGNFIERIVITLMVLAPNFLGKFNLKLWDGSITKFFVSLIDDTIKSRQTNGTKRNDFMQDLMHMKNNDLKDEQGNLIEEKGLKLTSVQLAAQAFFIFQAGYDTSSSASSFTLYELSLQQDIQSRVRQEILETLERHGGECTYEAIMEMKYLLAVIEETLRFYPPVNFLFRECTRNYTIPGTDVVIEKDTLVYIPIVGMQTDPRYYDDPKKYNPDRFLIENKGKILPCSFLSFGEGPRSCLGQKFGMVQSALALVTVLKNYKVSPCEKTDIPVKLAGSPVAIEPLSICLKVTEV